MNRISRSLFKENKWLSVALLGLYSIIIALMMILIFFESSFDATVDRYFDEYKVFDLNVLTAPIPKEQAERLAGIDGVSEISTRMLQNTVLLLEEGGIKSVSVLSISGEDSWKVMDVEEETYPSLRDDSVMVSAPFAEKNGLVCGDRVSLKTPEGYRELTITNVIACPETMVSGTSAGSWFDLTSYGMLFLSTPLYDSIFGTQGYVNNVRILTEEGADRARIGREAEELLGSEVIADITDYDHCQISIQLAASMDAIRSISTIIPTFIVGIGLVFSAIFVSQIVRKSRKNIGLLRALGYSIDRIYGIFLQYMLLITVVSAVIGVGLGMLLLRLMLSIYKGFYYFPYSVISGSVYKVVLLFLVVILMATASVILSARGIGRVEPSAAYGSREEQKGQIPRSIGRIRCNPFTKIVINMTYRNRGRVLVTSCCTLICIILSMLAISMIVTKDTALKFTFDERYTYDIAYFSGSDEALSEIAGLASLKNVKADYYYDCNYEGEPLRIESNDSVGERMGIVLEEGFARRHKLAVGDCLMVDGKPLTVIDIIRQYLCSTQYVSYRQAEEMGWRRSVVTANYNADGAKETVEAIAARDDRFGELLIHEETERDVTDSLNQIDIPCYVFIAAALLLGFLIMYNMNLISFSKRRREFATLRVLGTGRAKLFLLLAGESVIEFVPACLVAPVGFPIIEELFLRISSMAEEFVAVRKGEVFLLSCLLALLCTAISVIGTYIAVLKMDYVAELNDKE